jgi:hypothetical protein
LAVIVYADQYVVLRLRARMYPGDAISRHINDVPAEIEANDEARQP